MKNIVLLLSLLSISKSYAQNDYAFQSFADVYKRKQPFNMSQVVYIQRIMFITAEGLITV